MTDVYFCHFPKQEIRKLKTIFDFGANAGYFSLLAASMAPDAHVFAFEPLDRNFDLLKNQIEKNQLHNIRAFQMAVSQSDGETEFFADSRDSTSTCASLIPNGDRPHSFKVKTTSLKTIFEKNHLDSCDFLKMDIEGGEYDVFYQASESILRRIKRIAMEVHEGSTEKENVRSLKSFLEKHDFKVQIQGMLKLHLLWATRS